MGITGIQCSCAPSSLPIIVRWDLNTFCNFPQRKKKKTRFFQVFSSFLSNIIGICLFYDAFHLFSLVFQGRFRRKNNKTLDSDGDNQFNVCPNVAKLHQNMFHYWDIGCRCVFVNFFRFFNDFPWFFDDFQVFFGKSNQEIIFFRGHAWMYPLRKRWKNVKKKNKTPKINVFQYFTLGIPQRSVKNLQKP